MKNFWIFFVFFLTACSSNLPNQERTFSEFIPQEVSKEKSNEVITNFDFTIKKFPKNCDWQSLKRIVDGDTIIVGENIRVRLIGIDTPETKHPKKPIQKFGIESSAQMEEYLEAQKEVCLITDSIGDSFDKYDRKLAYVYREDGFDINAEMLRIGLARGYFGFPFERKEEFRIYEKEAKNKKLNIWK